ncbi:MAG: class IV adenylate cyclase [Candidatus Berkelbacteria bacterium]
MKKNYIEKEIKLRVANPLELIETLKSEGAEFLGKTFEKTLRFEKEGQGLEKEGIFLRLKSGFVNKITLKKKLKTSSDVFEREEIETTVGDIEKMRAILNSLGFTNEFIMEKYRQNWKFNGTEIALDEMPFGFFIEIEGEESRIWDTCEKLKLDSSNKIVVTYWDLFDDHKKETGLVSEHIQFEKDYIVILG